MAEITLNAKDADILINGNDMTPEQVSFVKQQIEKRDQEGARNVSFSITLEVKKDGKDMTVKRSTNLTMTGTVIRFE